MYSNILEFQMIKLFLKNIGQRSVKMAANFLAPFSVLVFAVLLGQKSYYMPHSMMGIDGFGLNITLASSDPILTGFVAIHSHVYTFTLSPNTTLCTYTLLDTSHCLKEF